MKVGYRYRRPTNANPNARDAQPNPRESSWVGEGYREYPFINVGPAVSRERTVEGAYGTAGGRNQNSSFLNF